MLMTVGFGYAKPVPINPYNFKHQKRGIFTVAIAGVTVNFILAFCSSGLFVLFSWLQIKFPGAGTVISYFSAFFYYMIIINLSFFFFNLLPIPALDGSKVIFCLIEWIFRKPVPRKIEAVIHAVGFVLILGFAVLVDILQFVHC